MDIVQEFLKYKHQEQMKSKPITCKREYKEVLMFVIEISNQLLSVKKDVLGDVLSESQLRGVQHLTKIAENELNLLQITLSEV